MGSPAIVAAILVMAMGNTDGVPAFKINQVMKISRASNDNICGHSAVLPSGESSPHWGYSGENGPDNWKDMEGYGECGLERQSPIDLANAVPKEFPDFNFQG